MVEGVGFAVGVTVGAAMNRLIKISRAAGRREADTTANLTVKIVDLFANMKALKAMPKEEEEAKSPAQNIAQVSGPSTQNCTDEVLRSHTADSLW